MTRIAKIYNYQNQYIEAILTHKVVRIEVEILTGDEIVTFYYDNGESVHFDSGEIVRRIEDLPCGEYSVTDPEEIDEWISFQPTEYPQSWRNDFPDQRMQKFTHEEESVEDLEENPNYLDSVETEKVFTTESLPSDYAKTYIAIDELPEPKPVEEGNFSNEDFTKIYNRGFADGWNALLQEIKDLAVDSDE